MAARCCPDWCWTPPGLTISVRKTVEMADRRTASAAVTFREKEFVLGMLRQSTTRGREDRVRPPPSTTLPRKVGETLPGMMQSMSANGTKRTYYMR